MKQKFFFLAAAALLAVTPGLRAQHIGPDGLHHCGTDHAMAEAFAANPGLKAQFELLQQQAEEQDRIAYQDGYRETDARSMPPVYIIPVVFHIIHDYGAENISDAQVLDQMRILNEDFRKQNADTTLIVPAFQGIAADAEIEFRLANLDPNGNCTNGIDRIYSYETYVGDDGSKLNSWPRSDYLNVWVVKNINSGAAGYAYLPGGAPSAAVDGIIILSQYVGSIGTGNVSTSRALTHEIGHFLNLQHVWGSSNNPNVSCGNDGVTDTPVTEGWTSCNLTSNDECNPGIEENVQNFMEYAYCSRMFTQGQRTRMRAALNASAGSRNNLWTASNLTSTGTSGSPVTCSPEADFLPVAKVYVCPGASVTFTDMSSNATPTSWNWSFPGGTPSSSTVQNPTIQYNTPGVYAVTLTSANSAGSNMVTRTGHVTVLSSAAQFSTWNYVEDVENNTTFTSDWTIVNPQGNGWARSTTAAVNGVASARLTNTSSMLGTIDEMISPTIDFSAMQNPVFTFKVAFCQRVNWDQSLTADKLKVFTSVDCGQTWQQRYLKTGATLSTRSATNTSFVPTSSQWRTETINISSVITAPNVRIKFQFSSDGGNNIYIDDINIQGTTGVDSPDAGISQFSVFPNPAQDNTMISFSLQDQEQVNLQLIDMTGREVMNVYSGELAAGQHMMPVNTAELSSGIYFIRLSTAEGRNVTQKLVVE